MPSSLSKESFEWDFSPIKDIAYSSTIKQYYSSLGDQLLYIIAYDKALIEKFSLPMEKGEWLNADMKMEAGVVPAVIGCEKAG